MFEIEKRKLDRSKKEWKILVSYWYDEDEDDEMWNRESGARLEQQLAISYAENEWNGATRERVAEFHFSSIYRQQGFPWFPHALHIITVSHTHARDSFSSFIRDINSRISEKFEIWISIIIFNLIISVFICQLN
jgi:hypothetical protein